MVTKNLRKKPITFIDDPTATTVGNNTITKSPTDFFHAYFIFSFDSKEKHYLNVKFIGISVRNSINEEVENPFFFKYYRNVKRISFSFDRNVQYYLLQTGSECNIQNNFYTNTRIAFS